MTEYKLIKISDGDKDDPEMPYATIKCDSKETFDMLADSVEKQRPKEPKKDCIYHHPTRWCRRCNKIVIKAWEYCPYCGQRNLWR